MEKINIRSLTEDFVCNSTECGKLRHAPQLEESRVQKNVEKIFYTRIECNTDIMVKDWTANQWKC